LGVGVVVATKPGKNLLGVRASEAFIYPSARVAQWCIAQGPVVVDCQGCGQAF